MPYKIRRSDERKFYDHNWLKTHHTFSFGNYYDPNNMGFRSLRVINEDRVAPQRGFPPHNHQNMEIISLVLEGQLAHKDSTGTEAIIHTNDLQQMSAGSGVIHSEYNPSKDTWVHFLQIWILPDEQGIKPRYQQLQIPTETNKWALVASRNGTNGSIQIQQDANVFICSLDIDKHVALPLSKQRYGWLQIIEGTVELETNPPTQLRTGDAVAIHEEDGFYLKCLEPCRILFFDLN